MTLAVNCNSTGPVPVELVEGEHDASALHVDVRVFFSMLRGMPTANAEGPVSI